VLSGSITLSNNDAVTLSGRRTFGVGASQTSCETLPTTLTTETIYYIVNKVSTTFSLAEVPNGPPIVIAPGPSGSGVCPNRATSGTLTLIRVSVPTSKEYSTSTLVQPTDIKIADAGTRAYVTDGSTGILWQVALDGFGDPVTWTQVNVPFVDGSYPLDKTTGSIGSLGIQLIRPLGITVVKNPSGPDPDNLLIAESTNSDPARQPGGTTIRLFCSSSTAPTVGICKGRTTGFYRMAGSFMGIRGVGAANDNPLSAPMTTTFQAPTGIAVGSDDGTLDPTSTSVYLTSGGTDAGVFKLTPQFESGPAWVKYGLSDAYGNTATQCLRFQTAMSCDDGDSACSCRAISPLDMDVPLWSPAADPSANCDF